MIDLWKLSNLKELYSKILNLYQFRDHNQYLRFIEDWYKKDKVKYDKD